MDYNFKVYFVNLYCTVSLSVLYMATAVHQALIRSVLMYSSAYILIRRLINPNRLAYSLRVIQKMDTFSNINGLRIAQCSHKPIVG